jgi:chloramphenicol 3-O-phosphotransferase
MCAMDLHTVDAAGDASADEAVPEVEAGLPRPESEADREKQRLVERLKSAANPASDRDKLRERMGKLEPGHPSYPWDENGKPKPAETRPPDLERPEPPLSDADYAAHLREVTKVLDEVAAADPPIGTLHTVDRKGQIWTPERNKIHGEIVAEAYKQAGDVPCEHSAIIAGGLGGAGKTTVLENYAGIDLSKYLMINPDSFKERLAERGLVAKFPGLSPMEATTFYHEESSAIARRLALRAMADGKNVIWDITMSSKESTAERIDQLRAANYERIDGIFVDIPVETSVTRSEARHRRGHDEYLAGQGLGGRYVPPELICGKADTDFGTVNRKTFEALKDNFTDWAVYDNSQDGRPPTLIDRKNPDLDSS